MENGKQYIYQKVNNVWTLTSIKNDDKWVTENFIDELFIRFGIKSELIPLVVSLFVLAAVKVSVNTWCDFFYDSRVRENEKMLEALKEMTDK